MMFLYKEDQEKETYLFIVIVHALATYLFIFNFSKFVVVKIDLIGGGGSDVYKLYMAVVHVMEPGNEFCIL